MYRTFVERVDEYGTLYETMIGNTIKSKKRAISRIGETEKGWVIDANTGKVVHVAGFGKQIEECIYEN